MKKKGEFKMTQAQKLEIKKYHPDSQAKMTGTLPKISKAEPKTSVMTVHNDQKLFGQMKGLGPVNIGTDAWKEAMLKQERINTYVNQLNSNPRANNNSSRTSGFSK